MSRFTTLSLLFSLCYCPVIRSSAADRPTPKLSIQFLSKKRADAVIFQEKIEPYFALMTELDMNAKLKEPVEDKTGAPFVAEFKKRYQAAILEFNDDEEKAITACLKALEPTFAKHYPLLLKTPWRFIKKANSIEGGAHFTREDCIVLSQGYTRAIANRYKQVEDESMTLEAFTLFMARLLLHEQTHVLQRLHPKRFADLYVNQWKYMRSTKIEDHAWLKVRRAVNPDGVDIGWVFPLVETDGDKKTTRYLWTQIIYTKTEGHPRLFRDTAMIAVELDKTKDGFRVKVNDRDEPVYEKLQSLRAFVSKFPFGGAYHPNEAGAGVLPVAVLSDYYPPRVADDGPAKALDEQIKPVRDWFHKKMR